jgi:ectoine hydroxylase-related dioxygenase (phytanoyl-CoA dioxygenase family)
MLYVNDINKLNGAFCLSPGSHKWVDNVYGKYRYFQKFNKFENISRSIPEIIINKLVPIEGKAGTIIVFYTNCIHHQGIVKEGECKIVRSHYRKKLFN